MEDDRRNLAGGGSHRTEALHEVLRTRDLTQVSIVESLFESAGLDWIRRGTSPYDALPLRPGPLLGGSLPQTVLLVRSQDLRAARDLLAGVRPEDESSP